VVKRNLLIAAFIAVAVAGMLWFGKRHARMGAGTGLAGGEASVRGQAAPEFKLTEIRTGKSVQLSDFRGKAVLLNFWATWCPPCKVEIPWFVDLQKQYGPRGLQVIGVAMDDEGSEKTIAEFSQDMGINYLILRGTERVADQYGGVESLPTTFYIGRDGKIAKRVFGLTSHREIENSVNLLLRQDETATAHAAPAGGH
jgi:cytochrome c biogenesis protein CcmG/thiol:disulfide interchange protein DsbE